jgi:FSR family fosmidomycin resistance protein-like MFS transporter
MRKLSPATLKLVLLVSCAHAMVHVYEHSLATVEQSVVSDAAFNIPSDDQLKVSGSLGKWLRLPFGLFALAAGFLADRLGAGRLLLVYLFGCSFAAILAWYSPTLAMMTSAMFCMGLFASIYHPAGLTVITQHTTPENLPMALGYHGIFGSLGIALGPFLAAVVLGSGATWRQYYLLLAVPGIMLAVLFLMQLSKHQEKSGLDTAKHGRTGGDEESNWPSYFTLIGMACMSGIVYAAIFHFLPRYLDGAGLGWGNIPQNAFKNYLTAGVLLLGIIGQYTAGRTARPNTLEPLMSFALFATVPFILWMGWAEGGWRLVAAAIFSPLFFMHQPLFNSMVAKYVPRRQRSLCFGLSFTVGFGMGSMGTEFAGHVDSYPIRFSILAALMCICGTLALVLWIMQKRVARV